MKAQKCPVCNGTRLVSRPPGIAGDQNSWTSSSCGPYPCSACGGSGLIWIENTMGSTATEQKRSGSINQN